MLESHLRTARLTLRAVAPTDEAAIVGEINHFEISKWLAVVPYPYSATDFRYFLDEIARPGETFVIADSDGLAGVISLQDDVLGYWLALRAQGRGYATEAGIQLLSAHFSKDKEPVRSGYFVGNLRSARVLSKLGFVEVDRDIKHCHSQQADLPHVAVVLTSDVFAVVLASLD